MQCEFQYSTPRKYFMSTKRDLFQEESSHSMKYASDSEIMDGDYVGYSNLSQQIYRRAMRRGFEFTLMVVGESGLGKSTFINNLFLSDIYGPDHLGPSHRIRKRVEVEETKVHLVENDVNLYLTVIDVPGFGDSLNNSGCCTSIIKLIDERHQQYLYAETQVNRGFIVDTRVHCCLYFIAPWGYGLKPIDIQAMKILHKRVNIVPIIAKADTFTADECLSFKEAIMKQIEENDIKIYSFPEYRTGDEINSLREKLPFAVMGSLSSLEGGERRGRSYPWGSAEVENTNHCDFIAIRNLLVRSHMHCLKQATGQFFEVFRSRALSEKAGEEEQFTLKMEEEKGVHEKKLKQLAEEMESTFQRKIAEKLQKLKESEIEIEQRSQQMDAALKEERRELEEKRAELERKKAEA